MEELIRSSLVPKAVDAINKGMLKKYGFSHEVTSIRENKRGDFEAEVKLTPKTAFNTWGDNVLTIVDAFKKIAGEHGVEIKDVAVGNRPKNPKEEVDDMAKLIKRFSSQDAASLGYPQPRTQWKEVYVKLVLKAKEGWKPNA